MEEVRDFAFLEEMDIDSLKEVIRAVKQQIEEKGGPVNQICPEQVDQLTEQVKQLMKAVNQLRVAVEQQERGQEVNQFTEQCLRRLETNEYGVRKSIGVSTIMLYRLYQIWCDIRGIEFLSQRAFAMEIRKLGYRTDKGKCLVKSYATDQVEDKQQIIYHYVPKIQNALLKEKIHEKLAEKEWSQLSALYALKAWFNKEDE